MVVVLAFTVVKLVVEKISGTVGMIERLVVGVIVTGRESQTRIDQGDFPFLLNQLRQDVGEDI
jgi:hypothetical protein